MLKLLKRFIVNSIPFKVRRRILFPMIVSNSYRDEIDLVEYVLQMRYYGINLDSEYWAAILRKYCHIIDKGLQRIDCEPGHSRTYYSLACDTFDNITDKSILNDPSVVWARNKIEEYEALQETSYRDCELSPFLSSACTYDQLQDIIKTRRSIRMFTERKVPRCDIEKIVSLINWAPSSCNRQTGKAFIADTPKIVEKCISANSGATCLSGNIPCFISFCADLRPYEMPHEMTLPVLDTSLGIQNCCLAAHSLGIGMTLLNWTHHNKAQDNSLREALGIPRYFRIIANAVLGYPSQGVPLPARKADKLTFTFVQNGN